MKPSFTISLDFELRWGIRDNADADGYEDAILGARRAVPLMLDLFEESGVAATWATVGFLFAEDRDELISHFPTVEPEYENARFSPFPDVQNRVGLNEEEDPLHYGLSLIRQILDTPQQEVGSHSFSHFYCLEKGGSPEAFGADMRAAQKIAQAKNVTVKSLVLPRNQLSVPHLEQAKAAGISVFRGNPKANFYQPRPRADERLYLRALRLADSVLPLTSTLATPTQDRATKLVDTPASRFLRPVHSTTSFVAKAQRRRIKAEMTRAAQQGKNYHLWWHPHNFGRETEANIENLRYLLKHFTTLRDRYDMQPKTMLELAQDVIRTDDWQST